MEYIVTLLIACFAVLVVPYYLSKLIIAWRKSSPESGGPSLSALVQREIQRLGGRSQTSPAARTKEHLLSRGGVLQIYQTKIAALKETGQDNGELQDLQRSVALFEAAQYKRSSHFQSLSQKLNALAKCDLALREVVAVTGCCLEEKIFIINQQQREVMSYSEVKNLIVARTLLHAFIQDARLQSSTVCKTIERSRNKSPELVYLAIGLLVLLKSGASQKGLYEQAIRSPRAIFEKFRQLRPHQINNAVLAILRSGPGKIIAAERVNQIIYNQIHQFEQFKREFIQQKSREQEKKRRFVSEPLQKYYDILGCYPSDSTATIKKCYRKLALKKHPDRVEGAQGHEEFIKIQQAYGEIIKARDHRKKAA